MCMLLSSSCSRPLAWTEGLEGCLFSNCGNLFLFIIRWEECNLHVRTPDVIISNVTEINWHKSRIGNLRDPQSS